MTPDSRFAVVLAVSIGLPSVVRAQALVQSCSAPQTRSNDAAGIGDLDGDGRSEIAVAWRSLPNFAPGAGIRVVSGASCAERYAISLPPSSGAGINVDAIGDVDLDGSPDFVAGAPDFQGPLPDCGAAFVYSGATGALIRSHFGPQSDDDFGAAVWGVGDLDNDGVRDYCVVARRTIASSQLAWRVDAFSGASGAALFSAPGYQSSDEFGSALADAGDVDGDGHDDLIVGAPAASGGGRVALLSGVGGTSLFDLAAAGAARFGQSVDRLDDVDNDGAPEIAVGSPFTTASPGAAGDLRVFSGATGQPLFGIPTPSGAVGFGGRLVRVGDVDGDGRGELAVESEVALTRHLGFFSGADGGVVDDQILGKFPFALGALDDFDLDGRRDLYLATWQGYSTIEVHHSGTASSRRYCNASSYSPTGCTPWLWFAGGSSLSSGPTTSVAALYLPTQTSGWFVWSLAPANQPFFNGTLCVSRTAGLVRMSRQTTPSSGSPCSQTLARELDRAHFLTHGVAPGTTIYGQYVTRMPNGGPWAMTEGLELTWAP